MADKGEESKYEGREHHDRKQKCPWCIGDMAPGDRHENETP